MMSCNTDWTPEQATKVAQLLLDPKTNGGLPPERMLGTPLPYPLPLLTEMVAHIVHTRPVPAELIEDGERLLQISSDPHDPDGQGYLHFAARGYTAEEVRPQLLDFMARYPARQWVAIGTRPGLWRLICQPLGFRFVNEIDGAFLSVLDVPVFERAVN